MSLDPALPLASPRVLSAKPLGARYLAIYWPEEVPPSIARAFPLAGFVADSFDSPLSAISAASGRPSAAVTSTLRADSLFL